MSITVLMTTYNCGEYISQAIKSVLNQTYKDFEFLIIDDGSADNTSEIVKSFDDKRIVYKKTEHMGRSKALNYGLSMAMCDWIAIMDADDVAHTERLKMQLDKFNFNNNAISCTWSIYFSKSKIKYLIQTPITDYKLKQKMALHSLICNSSVIFNKNFILANGGYNENLDNSEDYELWLRILNKAHFYVIPEYLLFIRERNDSLSRTDISNTKQQVIGFLRTYSDLENYFKFLLQQIKKLLWVGGSIFMVIEKKPDIIGLN